MIASVLIVSKNRKNELELTLSILKKMLDFSVHEVLVFLDGCTDDSKLLIDNIAWVKWFSTEKSIGASAARHKLYPNAQGLFLIGFDDDAHPLNSNFIEQTIDLFDNKPNLGIIAFQEIKGVFNSDKEAEETVSNKIEEYYTNEFIGSGFAIRREIYLKTNGFPVWIDIYGEESCVALEVIANGYDILYSSKIKINHRVNKELRKTKGQNYFRFGKQLKNTTYYYLVYYPFPIIQLAKLYLHNFKKYALFDFKYFQIFFKSILEVLSNLLVILKYRNPVNKEVIKNIKDLKILKF
jgi:GT2 family glycosyltransferase